MKTKALINKLLKEYPVSAGYEGDFIGLQTGNLKEETKTIAVCLDFDYDVYEIIKDKNVDLILTHHPLIYGIREEVLDFDKIKAKLVKTIDEKNIPVYSLHTNFDGAKRGMNYALASALNLKHIKNLKGDKLLRGGELDKEMDIIEFANYVKQRLNLDYVSLINKGKLKVKKIALCGGSGAGFFWIAMNEGYDIFLSGDTPHHIRHDVNCYKYNYLEIAHEVEKIFIPTITKYIRSIDKNLKIIEVDTQHQMKII